MALSKTEICNGAIALLGAGLGATAWLTDYATDTGPTADWCRKLYDQARRRALLKWDFTEALQDVAATAAGTDDVTGVNHLGYDYAYLIPNEPKALALRAIVDEDGTTLEHKRMGRHIYTNYETDEFYWRFVEDLETTAYFSEPLVRCIEYELAILLAGPTLKGAEGTKMRQALIEEYTKWVLADSRGENESERYDTANESLDDAWYEVSE